MRIVKRYSNRKLYDFRTISYITIDELIQSFLLTGEKFKVIDFCLEDITPFVLGKAISNLVENNTKFDSDKIFDLISGGDYESSSGIRKL